MLAKEKEETLALGVASFFSLGRVGGLEGGSGTAETLVEGGSSACFEGCSSESGTEVVSAGGLFSSLPLVGVVF